MGLEIERKFLISSGAWRKDVFRSEEIRQAYLADNDRCSIRVRICDDQAWLNIKSATIGASRQEFEYAIPIRDGEQILSSLCTRPFIEKSRHFVKYGSHVWEIDEFFGENMPLIVAEIELDQLDEQFERPPWLGAEVTHDRRYYNSSLAENPYVNWQR